MNLVRHLALEVTSKKKEKEKTRTRNSQAHLTTPYTFFDAHQSTGELEAQTVSLEWNLSPVSVSASGLCSINCVIRSFKVKILV